MQVIAGNYPYVPSYGAIYHSREPIGNPCEDRKNMRNSMVSYPELRIKPQTLEL